MTTVSCFLYTISETLEYESLGMTLLIV